MAIINLSIEFADKYIDTIKAFMVSRAGEFTDGKTTITNAEVLSFIEDHFQRVANRFAADSIQHVETTVDKTVLPASHQAALTALNVAQTKLSTERVKARPVSL